ncbi:MAG: response regulator [Methylococcales bacterium]
MKNILVVDDEPHILSIITHFLRGNDYNVITAINGEDGLQKCFEFKPAAIITDLQMPRMDGTEMCDRLNHEYPELNPLIVVMTSRTEQELRHWASKHSNVLFKEKPVSPRDLVTYLDDYFVNEAAAAE